MPQSAKSASRRFVGSAGPGSETTGFLANVWADDFKSTVGSAIRLGVELVVPVPSSWTVRVCGTTVGAFGLIDGFVRTSEIFLAGAQAKSVNLPGTETKSDNARPSVKTGAFEFNWPDRTEVN